MTDFNPTQQATILHRFVKQDLKRNGTINVPFTRVQIQDAAQACRDVLDAVQFRSAVSTAIDTAVSPETMNNDTKKRLFARVMQEVFVEESV